MLEPSDSNFKSRVLNSFAAQGAMSTLGGRLVSVEPGRINIELPYSEKITQQHGYVHAGVLTAMMDSAAGFAAYSLMPEKADVLTIEFKTSLMSPAQGKQFRFEGRVIKSGRTITFTEADAFAIDAEGCEKKVASMTATMMSVTVKQTT